MSRLPIIGGDPNTWAVILNDYLSQSLNSDGTPKNVGPVPTGSGDDVPLQAYVNACQTAGTTPNLTRDGTYVLNNPLTISGSCNFGTTNQTFQASSTFSLNSPVIQTPGTATGGVWTGTPTIDCNHRAFAVSIPSAAGLIWNGGFNARNPLGQVMVVAAGFNFIHTGTINFGSSTGVAGAGSVGILNFASDSHFGAVEGTIVETGIVNYGQDCTFDSAHISNPFSLQAFLNFAQQGGRFLNCIADTLASVAHAGATGSGASSTITDAAVSAYHQGLRVTGTNIPANSFVGVPTAGVSFPLLTATGSAATPTGTVTGITLMPCGFNAQGATQIIGGLSLNNNTVGGAQDSTFDAFVVGSVANTSKLQIVDHLIWGTSATLSRFQNAIAGGIGFAEWTGLQQQNVVNPLQTRSGILAGGFINTTASASPSATLNTFGSIVTLSPNTPSQGLVPDGYVIQPSGLQAGEVVTCSINFLLSNSGSAAITVATASGSNSSINSGAANMAALVNNNAYVTGVQFKIESSINSSTAAATLKVYGVNVG